MISNATLAFAIINAICAGAEQERRDTFNDMVQNGNALIEYIVFVEKASYVYTEGLGATPLIEESYFTYWDGESIFDIM